MALAVLALIGSQFVMVLIMTMTPLHMTDHGHDLSAVGISLTGAVSRAERPRVQGVSDALIWSTSAIASLGSGLVVGVGIRHLGRPRGDDRWSGGGCRPAWQGSDRLPARACTARARSRMSG